MEKNLKSRKGISPILATLLLIVIAVAAVIITYAWIMTFTGSEEAVLTVDYVKFYTQESNDRIEFIIKNVGTADAKVAEVYQGATSSDLNQISSVTYEPSSQLIKEGSSLTITVDINWESEKIYYFKVVTEEGISLHFSEEAV
jgi:flagellin-like protein